MRKKLLVMGVVVLALLSFSGIASSSVYMQYWDRNNTRGWQYHGELLPGFTFWGKYNWNDHTVWKEFDGEIYVPTHENWHINMETKCLDGNKPVTMLHYNFMYQLDSTPTRYKKFYMGYLHIVDPKASDKEYQGYQPTIHYTFIPSITKWMDQRREPPYGPPTIEDTTTLIDYIFNNLDFDLIPVINRIDLYDIEGNVMTIDVSLLNQQ